MAVIVAAGSPLPTRIESVRVAWQEG